jgi:hypothetical protein
MATRPYNIILCNIIIVVVITIVMIKILQLCSRSMSNEMQNRLCNAENSMSDCTAAYLDIQCYDSSATVVVKLALCARSCFVHMVVNMVASLV